ncbi:MAG: sensor histidine kinase [Opitutaceae bacterium]
MNSGAIRPSRQHVRQLRATLRRRTAALVVTTRWLKRETIRRKAGEAKLRQSTRNYSLLLAQSRCMQEELRRLAHQILSTQEEERKKISRELHDEIAQTLAGINVQLAALSLEAAVSARRLKAKIASTQRQVGRSIEAIHRFARELRPALLDDLGLIPALRSYMKKFAARTGLHIRFTAFTGVESLNNAKRTVLYRIAQEALTNVVRHAQASLVQVSIRKIPDAIRMEVADDGRSFQVQRVLSSRTNKRLGLLGMRERVEMVGGSFAIESAPGRGTTIRAQIPFKRAVLASSS